MNSDLARANDRTRQNRAPSVDERERQRRTDEERERDTRADSDAARELKRLITNQKG